MTDMTLPEKKIEDEATARVQKRLIYRLEAMDAAARFRILPDSKCYVARFSTGQLIEHYSLLVSFTLAGITGLAQTFSRTNAGNFILTAFGGMDAARQVHHMAAIVLGMQFIYHVLLFFYLYIKWGRVSKVMPEWRDVSQFIQMFRFNLGITKQYPRFDRFNFEEKITYWTVALGVVLMGATGLLQWFPIAATFYLPGWAIPAGRMLHRWEAILLVLFIFIWHTYHSTVRKSNKSMFTGLMSIEDMQKEHPLELDYLEKSSAMVNNQKWPALIEIALDEKIPVHTSKPDDETGGSNGIPEASGEQSGILS